VAENLGVITPAVEELRHKFGLPGMSLLQFAFGTDSQGSTFRPHNYSRDLAAYTGGHDNDTTVGWWTSSGAGDSTRTPEDVRKEHETARAYLDFHDDTEINWVMISRGAGLCGEYCDCAAAGCAGTGQRSADESSRQDERELEMAVSQRRVAP